MAEINIKDNEGKTALMYAAKDKDNLEKVKLLIEFGADINTKDNDGNTALK
ncbi:MAG: ankyrin repeat domain-containing protein [Cyanobacteria bacterium P01_A01_bin.83]